MNRMPQSTIWARRNPEKHIRIGGTNKIQNLDLAHRICNLRKYTKDYFEMLMKGEVVPDISKVTFQDSDGSKFTINADDLSASLRRKLRKVAQKHLEVKSHEVITEPKEI